MQLVSRPVCSEVPTAGALPALKMHLHRQGPPFLLGYRPSDEPWLLHPWPWCMPQLKLEPGCSQLDVQSRVSDQVGPPCDVPFEQPKKRGRPPKVVNSGEVLTERRAIRRRVREINSSIPQIHRTRSTFKDMYDKNEIVKWEYEECLKTLRYGEDVTTPNLC